MHCHPGQACGIQHRQQTHALLRILVSQAHLHREGIFGMTPGDAQQIRYAFRIGQDAAPLPLLGHCGKGAPQIQVELAVSQGGNGAQEQIRLVGRGCHELRDQPGHRVGVRFQSAQVLSPRSAMLLAHERREVSVDSPEVPFKTVSERRLRKSLEGRHVQSQKSHVTPPFPLPPSP